MFASGLEPEIKEFFRGAVPAARAQSAVASIQGLQAVTLSSEPVSSTPS